LVCTADETLVLMLSSGEQIEATELHPRYVEGKGFVEAGKPRIGTAILTRAGSTLTIARIGQRPGRVWAYNFEV
jgi:pretoxin HINT domain-containing protein